VRSSRSVAMEYRSLGRTGVRVSALCLGTMNFGSRTSEKESLRIMAHAVDAGVNFIDTANIYSNGDSERIVGKAIHEGSNRDQLIVATKVYNPTGPGPNDRGLSRLHIIRECERSLRRRRTIFWTAASKTSSYHQDRRFPISTITPAG
ncbi:MAG: aldo/keto reductase, partial [Spirochaetota bacterium]